MIDQDRLLDLLVEWDAQRQQGAEPTPETLCPDDAAVREALRDRIAKRLRLEKVLEPPTIGPAEATLPPLPALDDYEIHEVLGHGGMGVVYKAHQRSLDRRVALKMILAGSLCSAEEMRRFNAEARVVAQFQHDNIVRVFDSGEQAGRSYLVLELVNGGTLAQQLAGQPMPPRQAAELVLTLARAVQHAHERGIIHRDLKPANILMQRSPGQLAIPKIADFGLAKRMDAQAGFTQTGAVMGTPSYMAPEQADGRTRDIGPAVDIYALGAILYEALTGRPPFSGGSMLHTLEQVRTHDPVAPRQLQPLIPRDLEVICLKCLEKLPRDRYATAAELANDLQAFLAGEPIRASDATLMTHVVRAVQRTSYSENFGLWSTVVFILAPFPLLASLTAYWLTWGQPNFPLVICNTTAVTMTLVQLILLLANWGNMRYVPSTQRRQITTVWLSHTLAGILLWFVIWYATPADRPELLLVIYPCWMVLVAMANFGLAAEVGSHYVIGGICLLLGVITVFIPYWAPLLLAVFATSNMTAQGVMLRQFMKQAKAAAKPTSEPGA